MVMLWQPGMNKHPTLGEVIDFAPCYGSKTHNKTPRTLRAGALPSTCYRD
jgi:hypothetical protein